MDESSLLTLVVLAGFMLSCSQSRQCGQLDSATRLCHPSIVSLKPNVLAMSVLLLLMLA